jgi:hypothetical protein
MKPAAKRSYHCGVRAAMWDFIVSSVIGSSSPTSCWRFQPSQDFDFSSGQTLLCGIVGEFGGNFRWYLLIASVDTSDTPRPHLARNALHSVMSGRGGDESRNGMLNPGAHYLRQRSYLLYFNALPAVEPRIDGPRAGPNHC